MRLKVCKGTPLEGDVAVPVSKYHEHRALLLAASASTPTLVRGASACRHVNDTLRALDDVGTVVRRVPEGHHVDPTGTWSTTPARLSMGSSGTTLYLMLGLLHQSQDRDQILVDGQHSLRNRPVGPLVYALQDLGVRVTAENGRLPVAIAPGPARGGHVQVSGYLSQWVSGLLLAGAFTEHGLQLQVEGDYNERPYVQLTVDMMREFGLSVAASEDLSELAVEPVSRYAGRDLALPSDYSSLAFLLAAAALVPDSDITIRGQFDGDHPEAVVLDLLVAMGADIEQEQGGTVIRVRSGRRLRAVDVDCRDAPDLLPILAVVASQAHGPTRFSNLDHVRAKESDRVRSMLQLRKMGVRVDECDDNITIYGPAELRGARISTRNDHRVQMAFTVAGLIATDTTLLTYPNASQLSYPTFQADLRKLGADLEVVQV